MRWLWGQVDRCTSTIRTQKFYQVLLQMPAVRMPKLILMRGTEYSDAQGWMSGEVTTASYWGAGIGTAVILNASANCYSEDSSAEVWSYGNAATLVPAYTDGIFFVVSRMEEEIPATFRGSSSGDGVHSVMTLTEMSRPVSAAARCT